MLDFLGENEKEFETTNQFLEDIKFYKMHIFKYSPRKGTKASEMKEQIEGKTKEERSQKLIELSNQNQKQYHEKYKEKEVEILWEEEKDGYYYGHTQNYIMAIAKVKEQKNLQNQMIKCRCIESFDDHILVEM